MLRNQVIRLAATFPSGSQERTALLASLTASSPRWFEDLMNIPEITEKVQQRAEDASEEHFTQSGFHLTRSKAIERAWERRDIEALIELDALDRDFFNTLSEVWAAQQRGDEAAMDQLIRRL